MITFDGLKEQSDDRDAGLTRNIKLNQTAQTMFDRLMGDDEIQENLSVEHQKTDDAISRTKDKFDALFRPGAVADKTEVREERQEPAETEVDIAAEPNSRLDIDGDVLETDDSGKVYKKNGELIPNADYTVNRNKYHTDERGRPVSCDANPEYTEEGSRNLKEQRESGGEERQDNDEGGHIIAKILGGTEGAENLVPMRRTINRGDYKKMENEISVALQEGKQVSVHIDLEYSQESQRPSRIKGVYYIDGVKTEVVFNNEENSTELAEVLEGKISDEDFDSLTEELNDMQSDGCPVSITSVKTAYDESGNLTKVTVGVLDESTGEKSYKVYQGDDQR